MVFRTRSQTWCFGLPFFRHSDLLFQLQIPFEVHVWLQFGPCWQPDFSWAPRFLWIGPRIHELREM